MTKFLALYLGSPAGQSPPRTAIAVLKISTSKSLSTGCRRITIIAKGGKGIVSAPLPGTKVYFSIGL